MTMRSIFVVVFAGMAAACAGVEDDTEEQVGAASQALATVTYSPVGSDAGYNENNWALGDWAPGEWKGECAPGQGLQGLSRNPTTKQLHGLLCVGTANGGSYSSPTTLDVTQHDDQRTPTMYGSYDWDPGYIKAECNNSQMMVGISHDPNGGVAVGHARCVSAGAGYASSCSRIYFGARDVNQSKTITNWDSGQRMNTCADGYVVKGFSKESNGAPRSVLCCRYSTIIF